MLGQLTDHPGRARRLSMSFARGPEQVREAQRLRFRVFAEEMGARLPDAGSGLDRDLFDPHCDHLLVRDEASGQVVGTYRLLPPEGARRLGSLYSEGEFDLVRLAHLRDSMVEVGRSCVHPAYRNGATIGLLWSGIADYMQRGGHQYLVGCASMSMGDGGHVAASVWEMLRTRHMAPVEYQVRPRCPLPVAALNRHLPAAVPPLIKGYLRLGAWVCGEPAWDPDFNTADLLILLPLARMSQRHARHFLGESMAA